MKLIFEIFTASKTIFDTSDALRFGNMLCESKDVDGTEIKVLDACKNGVELEIEVEILNKGNRGVAVINCMDQIKRKRVL